MTDDDSMDRAERSEDRIQATLDLINSDEITPEEASRIQSALFQRIGRNLGKAIGFALEANAGLKPLFRQPPPDLGLEDVSERSEGEG